MTSTMNTSRALTVAALLVTGIGIGIQFLAVPEDFPSVPPGPIIAVAIAAFVGYARWWWTPLVGVAFAVMLIVGGVMTGGFAQNLPDPVWPSVGSAIQLMGIATTLIAGSVASTRSRSLA
jgi:hypothetical protein